jgi:hypothetical protein
MSNEDNRVPVPVHTPGNEDSCICAMCIAQRNNNNDGNLETPNDNHDPSDPDCDCRRCKLFEESLRNAGERAAFETASPLRQNKRAAEPPLVSPDGKRQATNSVSSREIVLRSNPNGRTENEIPCWTPTAQPQGQYARGFNGPSSILVPRAYGSLDRQDRSVVYNLKIQSGQYKLVVAVDETVGITIPDDSTLQDNNTSLSYRR